MGQPEPPTFAELMHFGVKGMKWGVRRDRVLKGHKLADGTRAKVHTDAFNANQKRNIARKRSGINTLSNAEMRSLIERMNLERQYKDLAEKDTAGGKKLIKRIFLGNVERSANLAIATGTNGMVKRKS